MTLPSVELKTVAAVVAGVFIAGAILNIFQDTSFARYISRGLGG